MLPWWACFHPILAYVGDYENHRPFNSPKTHPANQRPSRFGLALHSGGLNDCSRANRCPNRVSGARDRNHINAQALYEHQLQPDLFDESGRQRARAIDHRQHQ